MDGSSRKLVEIPGKEHLDFEAFSEEQSRDLHDYLLGTVANCEGEHE